MKLGIVGSRRRHSFEDGQIIKRRILELNPSMLISGGCTLGADKFAELFALELGIPITIFYPKLGKERWTIPHQDVVKAMYARNKQIAYESDYLIALVAPDRRGGTENTIEYFMERLNAEENLEIFLHTNKIRSSVKEILNEAMDG